MERRPIHLRAYAEPPKSRTGGRGSKPSHYVLVFDTETYPDEAQRFRFGSFQFRRGGTLLYKGLFYDPEVIDEIELSELQSYRMETGGKLLRKAEWVERFLFKAAYSTNATIVGFNLPFDISRLAIGYASARAVRRRDKSLDRSMVGGFTFRLSSRDDRPRIRIRQLSRKAAFINFASPAQNPEGAAVKRGFFLDLKTLGDALTGEAFSLGRLAAHLGVKSKGDFKDFARKIDREFIEYAADDAEVTWQCYERLRDRYDSHGRKETSPTNIFSGASLGKAYLKAMRIKPWTTVQKDYDQESIGRIMSTYFGGRAEVHRRREVVRTLYCDFASMYPTVCTLMGLWRYVIAEGVEEQDATAETAALLAGLTVGDLRAPDLWARFQVIVQVKPDADIFPVRTAYGREAFATIGVNYLSADRPLWFTLADCIASKLLTGKAPEVVSAIRFTAKAPQAGLRPVDIAGQSAYRVDPLEDDFYRSLIDLRREVKARQKAANSQEAADRLEAEQLALKIIANATSYGIFIELNVEDADDGGEDLNVSGAEGGFQTHAAKRERPGTFFHPLLAATICGAARLMLAITERLLLDAGLDWAFCDTDSMAFAMPADMDPAEFVRRVEGVCAWFEGLNPYTVKGSILEMEKQNRARVALSDGSKPYEPLFCLAVSAKRYALFNLGDDGRPVIRKASAHGLGHLAAPYQADGSTEIGGEADTEDSGVHQWQEDVWRAIVEAAHSETPREVASRWHPALSGPAASKHAATTPELMKGLAAYNEAHEEPDRIVPFSFMLWLHARRWRDKHAEDPDALWNPDGRELKPAAAYVRNLADIGRIFDRVTGEEISPDDLRSYADILRSYHLHPEAKFLGGGWTGQGVLRRRHVFADAIVHIGKEADELDDIEEFGIEDEEPAIIYEASYVDRAIMVSAIRKVDVRKLKAEARVGHKSIMTIRNTNLDVSLNTLSHLYRAALRILARQDADAARAGELLVWAAEWAERLSIADLGRRLPHDPDNLRKALIGEAKAGKRLLDSIERFRAAEEELRETAGRE